MKMDFRSLRLSVNIIGTFLLCFLVTGVVRKISAAKHIQDAMTTGFLGSFTTFSALSMETVLLFENGQLVIARSVRWTKYCWWNCCWVVRVSCGPEEGGSMNFLDMLMVGLGGFLGAVTRYFIATKMNESGRFPFGTLLVNLAGSLLIGIVFGLELSRIWTLFLASGLAGALTTFSTLNKEIIELWRSGKGI